MAKFDLAYPVSPIHLNQAFGANPAHYAKFLDDNGNPQKGHMGLDLQAYTGQPVYAAHDGFAFNVGPDDHGGEGVYVRTTQPDDARNYHTTIYWHLLPRNNAQFPCPIQGSKVVKRGDQIGWADNSGAPFESSGTHLHLGLAVCDVNGNFKNRLNGFNGCIDAQPFFNGTYATDTVVNPPPPAVSIALLASQKAQAGNVSLANMLYSLVAVIRAWWTN